MLMLVTTGRYVDNNLRALARSLARAFSGEYAARGKKTIDTLVSAARRSGHNRVCVVSAGKLCFIKVDELGGWGWLPCCAVKSFRADEANIVPAGSISGSDAERLSFLFGFEGNEKAEAEITAERSRISEGDALEIEVDYEVQLRNDG